MRAHNVVVTPDARLTPAVTAAADATAIRIDDESCRLTILVDSPDDAVQLGRDLLEKALTFRAERQMDEATRRQVEEDEANDGPEAA